MKGGPPRLHRVQNGVRLLRNPDGFEGLPVVRIDAPPDAGVVVEDHHPGERLLDWNPAGCAQPGLKNDHDDRFAEVSDLLYLEAKTADRFREAFEKCAELVTAVVRPDLVLELDLWMNKHVELGAQLSGRVGVV